MDIPVYPLFDLVALEPWPAVITLALLFPAFGIIWRVTFSLWARQPSEGGFLSSWLLSARFLLFWLAFGHLAIYVLDVRAYAPDPDGLACLKILDREKDAGIIEACAKDLVLRETADGPLPTWYGAARLALCASEEQGRRLLGPLPQDGRSRFLEYLDDAADLLSRQRSLPDAGLP